MTLEDASRHLLDVLIGEMQRSIDHKLDHLLEGEILAYLEHLGATLNDDERRLSLQGNGLLSHAMDDVAYALMEQRR